MLLLSKGLRDALREAREDAKKSLTDVASEAGVGESVIRRLENGEASPQITSMDRYLDAYVKRTKRPLDALLRRAVELAPVEEIPDEEELERDLENAAQQSESNGPRTAGQERESQSR
jgi:transcriptional regulator with XRE-family HTH domain